MKRLTHYALALGSLFAGSLSTQAQTFTVARGDLVAVFYRLNAAGTGFDGDSLLINLGAGSTWRENTTDNLLVVNVGAELEGYAGDSGPWHDNSRLRWAIVGTIGATDPVTNGDPARTIYYSLAHGNTYGPDRTTTPTLGSTARASVVTAIRSFINEMNGLPGITTTKAFVGTSAVNDISEWVPPGVASYFNSILDPSGTFGVDGIGTSDGYTVQSALDVYRILHSTTAVGTDLSVGMTPGASATGVGQRIGTFTIDETGQIRLDMAPQTTLTGYQAWVSRQALSGADAASSADPDLDGLSNLIEFVVGGNPKSVDTQTKAPTISQVGNMVHFTYLRTDESAYLNPAVEQDSDLVGPWSPVVNGSNGVQITSQNDGGGTGIDIVTIMAPVGIGQNFFRLSVRP